MTDPVYVLLDRDDVLSWLGRPYPPQPGAPILRLPAESGLIDGAVAVYPVDGQPGLLWWVLDGIVPEQDAGPVDAALAALISGSVLEVMPGELPSDCPPPLPYRPHRFAAPAPTDAHIQQPAPARIPVPGRNL